MEKSTYLHYVQSLLDGNGYIRVVSSRSFHTRDFFLPIRASAPRCALINSTIHLAPCVCSASAQANTTARTRAMAAKGMLHLIYS